MSEILKSLALIESRQARHSMPGVCYSDLSLYQHDLEEIWYKNWIFVGHSNELEKPGSYFTTQIGDYPIVIVKNREHQIKALHNACRHRGSKVCTQATGRVANLVCPYHQWSYDLNGKLFNARSMDGLNFADYSLKPIHLEIINTQIYVCVADTPPSFAEFRDMATPFVTPYDLTHCKIAHQSKQLEHANWKLVFENNRECYHCHKGHPELNKSFVEDSAVAGCGVDEGSALATFWDACEADGLPSKMAIDDDGQYRFTRVTLHQEALSYTIDGAPAVTMPIHHTGRKSTGALLYFHYPSTWNHYLGDYMISFSITPVAPNQTMLTTNWLVHQDAVEGKDYDLANLIKVWDCTNAQDKAFVESVQIGVNSPAYQPGPFSDIEENGVCQFVDWYCATMTQQLRHKLQQS